VKKCWDYEVKGLNPRTPKITWKEVTEADMSVEDIKKIVWIAAMWVKMFVRFWYQLT